jgi:hypothetical protein
MIIMGGGLVELARPWLAGCRNGVIIMIDGPCYVDMGVEFYVR